MNNYPELAYYKYEWIPILEVAKDLIEREEVRFLCNAIYAAAQALRENRGDSCENRGDSCASQHPARAEEMISNIEAALGDHDTVVEWFHENHPDVMFYSTSYRLAWIDHIIEECRNE